MMLERIVGNSALKASLLSALTENKLPHSILLVGEEGTGTGFAARCLAADRIFPQGGAMAEYLVQDQISMAVHHEGGGDVGDLRTGTVREVIGLRGEGLSGGIHVDAVRAARAEMYNTALTGEGRAAIIYGAQKMNGSSANALLKILEEPPANTLFILTATGAAGVLPTIRSRCAQYNLVPPLPNEAEQYLRQAHPELPERQVQLLVSAFDGCIGRAEKILKDPAEAALFEDAQKIVKAAAARDELELLVLFSAYDSAERPVCRRLLQYILCLCDAALHSAQPGGLSAPAAAEAAKRTAEASAAIGANGTVKLVFTCLAIQLAEAAAL